MKKVLETGIEVVFAGLLAGCLFYCMVAGAGTTAYVILAAILSIAISVTLCAGFHYIRKLKKQLEELEEKKKKKNTSLLLFFLRIPILTNSTFCHSIGITQ